MNGKRAAIIVDHFCLSPLGGGVTYPRELVRALSELPRDDIDITLVGFGFSSMVEQYPFLADFRLLEIPMRRIPFYFDFRHFIIVPLVLRKHGFDAVIELTQSIPFLFKDYKLAGMVTDITPLMFPRLFKHPLASYLRHTTLLRIAFKRCDRIAAISETTRKDLIKHYRIAEEKIRLVPLAFSKSEYRKSYVFSRHNIEGRFILSVGTFQPRKNYTTLINAFDQFIEKAGHDDLFLVIVGELGWRYETIIATYNNAKHKDKIRFLHNVNDEELMNLYEQCLFFVYPSLYEGFGLLILEAMAFSKAVLISNSSSMAEFPVDKRFKVEPTDTNAFKENIAFLVESESDRIEQGKRNSEIAGGYSWSKAAGLLLDMISELL